LQFAKAGSAATLPQQASNISADVQRLSLPAMYLADSFAAGASTPTHV
jgi:nitrate reductase beta subunit